MIRSEGSNLRAAGVFLGLVGIAFMGFALLYLNLPPEYLLALIGGSGVLFLLVARPILSVHLFLALVYGENLMASDSTMTMMKGVGLIALVAWLLNVLLRKRLDLRASPMLMALAAFVGWSGISMVFAFDTSVALQRVFTFAQLGIATVMFASVVNTTERVRWILRALVGWTTLVAIHATAAYLTGATDTAYGVTMNRNMLGMYVDIAIVCAYLLLQMEPEVGERALLILSLPFLFVALALSFSRTGYIALAMALFLVAYRLARTRGYFILIAMLAMLGLIVPLLPEEVFDRVATIMPVVETQDESLGLRTLRWKYAARMIKDHPIVGVGPNNFVPALARYGRGELLHKRGLVVHNAYINVSAEEGLVGLFLFLCMIFAALREVTWVVRRYGGDQRPLVIMGNVVEISIIVMMIEALMGNAEYMKYFYILFGLACAIGRLGILASRERMPAASMSPTGRAPLPHAPAMPGALPSPVP